MRTSLKYETPCEHGRETRCQSRGHVLEILIRVRDLYLGLGIRMYRVMDATCTNKFMGLGRGMGFTFVTHN